MPDIVETCRNPAKTRTDALANLPVPCYRCLAYRPEAQTGCHFLENRPPADRVSPKRQPKNDQLGLGLTSRPHITHTDKP